MEPNCEPHGEPCREPCREHLREHVRKSGTEFLKRKSPMYPLVEDTSNISELSNFWENGCSTLGKVEDLMPRGIMSSEPRHWMVLGQLVMPVQCCAKAPAALLQNSTAHS